MGDIVQRRGLWWWRVLGKGSKIGDIPVGDSLLAALQRYRSHCGLPPLPLPAGHAAGGAGESTGQAGHAERQGDFI